MSVTDAVGHISDGIYHTSLSRVGQQHIGDGKWQADVPGYHAIFVSSPALTARFWMTDVFWAGIHH
jgi:hypothetical protein